MSVNYDEKIITETQEYEENNKVDVIETLPLTSEITEVTLYDHLAVYNHLSYFTD